MAAQPTSTKGSSESQLGQVVRFMTAFCSSRMRVTLGVVRQLCSWKPSDAAQGARRSGSTAA
jgi:hypothetical protein